MPKKKIMIVDDEASITQLLKFALEKTGHYEVFTENEGAKALASIRRARPDLLILDVNLPDVEGGQIMAAAQADPSLKDVPILFLTGSVSQGESDAGMTISGFPAMPKPIHIEKLLKRIEQSLL